MSEIVVKSNDLEGSEVSWFAPICNGDGRFLGALEPEYKSNWKNSSDVLLTADRLGYRNILCPSSYQVGQATWTFAAAAAPLTKQINLLPAIRCGEEHPPMLARAVATLDHILEGRLTLNIISSDLPGEKLESAARYQRSREVIEILKQAWTQDHIQFKGEFYDLELATTEPVKPYQQNGGPLLYFGGYSPAGKDLCAEHCDVYLLWPDTKENLRSHMEDLTARAASYGRVIDYGLRVHVIVRETESKAKQAARNLLSKLDHNFGTELRERSQDAKALGVALQTEAREKADSEGYAEPHLWTGIGKGRSGCGMALVGDPDQITQKLNEYRDMGFRSFILSGYPHREECELFARYVLPALKTVSLPKALGRRPDTEPLTPLGAGPRR